MAVMFFGQFLVARGTVSRESLLKAIEMQEKVNLKFGEMALSMGLITPADVERIHQAQRTEDLRFGDMAIKLGIITAKQAEEVLTRQKNNHLYIGEALVKVGALAGDDLPKLLAEFKADQAVYAVDRVKIPDGVPEIQTLEACADLTFKMLTRVVNLLFKQGECRFTDRFDSNDVVVAMDLAGSINAKYLLSVSAGVRDTIARGMLKQADVSSESREMLVDTVMEFANVACGNISAKVAQFGKTIELSPPEEMDMSLGSWRVPEGKRGLLFPIHVDGEKAELGIVI